MLIMFYQPFKTRNQFQYEKIGISNSSPRRHTNLRLRAAAASVRKIPASAATAFLTVR
jgi:hypothetical protein